MVLWQATPTPQFPTHCYTVMPPTTPHPQDCPSPHPPSWHGLPNSYCCLPTCNLVMLQARMKHMAGGKDYRLCFLLGAAFLLRHQVALLCSVCPSVLASVKGSSIKLWCLDFFKDGSDFLWHLWVDIFSLVFYILFVNLRTVGNFIQDHGPFLTKAVVGTLDL